MSETDAPTRHGRRARRLTPEEEAAQQALAAATAGDATAAPSVRGAVASPEADAPVPRLRKFGRHARIIELADPVDATVQTAPAGASPEPADEQAADEITTDHEAAAGAGSSGESDSNEPATDESSTTGATSTVAVDRDVDGVELGEMSVSEAPDPRPAPRFEGKVLQRSDDSGGRSLLWMVWVLIGLALLALIILLATGVLGPGGDAGALGAGSLGATASLSDTAFLPDAVSLPAPTPLEVTSA